MSPRQLLPFLALCISGFCSASTTPVWRPFSDESPWNQPIAANAALDPDSSALIADFATQGPLFINIKDCSISLYFVDADKTPRRAVRDSRPDVYGLGFEFPRSIPIPDDAVASPPVSEDSDNHLSIVDKAKGLEWGMWAARKDSAGNWYTGLGAVTDLKGSGVTEPWYAAKRELDSARGRASGFPLIAGLILLEEIKAGRIEHALVFAYNHCRGGFFIPPASTAQVTVPKMRNTFGIPMGGRIQLDPTWDVEKSGLSKNGKVIARALQKYGAYCSDYADANVIYAENSPEAVRQWEGLLDKEELARIFTPEMIRNHFRVVDMGNVLPGQNCEIPPPYLIRLALSGVKSEARIDYFTHRIFLSAPSGTDLRQLVSSFEVYPRGTKVFIDGKEQTSGTTCQDFSKPLSLRLIAPDGASNTWTVLISAGI